MFTTDHPKYAWITLRKKTALAALFTCIPILFFLIRYRSLFYDTSAVLWHYGWYIYAFIMVFAGVIAASVRFCLPKESRYTLTLQNAGNFALFFLLPILAIQMVECFDNINIYDYSVQTFFANYSVYISICLLFYLLLGSVRYALLLCFGCLYLFATANHLVTLFRGSPVVPMDLLSITTAANVSGNYDFHLTMGMVTGTLTLCCLACLAFHSKSLQFSKLWKKRLFRVSTLVPLGIFLFIFYQTDTFTNMGYKPDFWNQSRGYQNTGSFFNFCLNSKYLFLSEPDGYRADEIEALLKASADETKAPPGIADNTAKNTDKSPSKPNIICIMNESFSDLSVVGDFETNRDYMPFFRSLTKNTIKGNLYVPVKGAGTSNSEFEFLTGASCAFLPAGSNAYELYIKNPLDSLVTTLKKQGYSALAFHPYYGDGWKRNLVYPLLQFDQFISIESFIDQDILDAYRESNDSDAFTAALEERYPGNDMLLRRFVSDSYDYQMIEEAYENRDTSKPFFCFNVTMQNHGGYTRDYNNFIRDVYVKNTDFYPEMTNRYLSLIRESDQALKQLIHYFKNVEEPTIICMFGDHQPYLENAFYEMLFGKDLSELTKAEDRKQYITPFMIWANYDIDSAEFEELSANYLSTLLLQTAGLELTDYQRYLASLYQKLPVINTTEYMGDNGVYYQYDEPSPYTKLIKDYEKIQYHYLFERENRSGALFRLP